MLAKFEAWKEATEVVYVNTDEISSIRQFKDRLAYGGLNDISEICLKNGTKFKVFGNACEAIRRQTELPL